MRTFMEDIGIPVMICFAIMIFIFGLIGVWVSSAQCRQQADKMGVPHSWGVVQDCMVQVDGKWIKMDAYKVVKVTP